MRVSEEQSGVLVVRETPWGFGVILVCVSAILLCGVYVNWDELSWFLRLFMGAFVGLLWIMFFQVAAQVTARFDRLTGRIQIARRGWFGKLEENYSLRNFKRARVEKTTDDGAAYRLVLVFSEGMSVNKTFVEKRNQRGYEDLQPNEVPFTFYLSSAGRGPTDAAAAINDWARVIAS